MWQQVELALSQSAHRVLFKLASFLPALLALILAIIILTAVGAGLAAILRRILTAAKFDERIARNSGGWAPSQSPTDLFARTAFWACVVLGVFIGVSAFDAAYPGETEISLLILPYLTHSVGAIILLIVGTILARFLGRSVLISSVNAKLQYARVLSLGVKWLVLVLTAAMVLDHLQIGGTIVDLAFGILFGGIVFTLSLAVGLGSREIVSRSLKKDTLDPFPPDPDYKPHPPTETLRHF